VEGAASGAKSCDFAPWMVLAFRVLLSVNMEGRWGIVWFVESAGLVWNSVGTRDVLGQEGLHVSCARVSLG